jgi:hypothetical protein
MTVRCSSFQCATFAIILSACGGTTVALGGGGDSGCVPGVYEGTYDCTTGADASAPSGSGPLSLRLEGDVGGKVLNIAPGTKISTSQSGVMISGELSGTLDCATGRLQGSLGNVMSSSASFTLVINGTGDFSANYDARSSHPALVDGVLDPPQVVQSALGTLMGTCTWSAMLH